MTYLLLLAVGVVTALLVWHRKPPGRGANPTRPGIRLLTDFDAANPQASGGVRDLFYISVQAHLGGDLLIAKAGYQAVLSCIPGEPTSLYNLDKL